MWIKPDKPRVLLFAFQPDTFTYQGENQHNAHIYTINAYWVDRKQQKLTVGYGQLQLAWHPSWLTPLNIPPLHQLTYQNYLTLSNDSTKTTYMYKTQNRTWTNKNIHYNKQEITENLTSLLNDPNWLPPDTDGWYANKYTRWIKQRTQQQEKPPMNRWEQYLQKFKQLLTHPVQKNQKPNG